MNENYYRHYLTLDAEGRIVGGWSNGPRCGRGPGEHDVLLTDAGSYDFRLFPEGEANPALLTEEDIPLYKWENGAASARTEAEIEADRAAWEAENADGPTEQDRLAAQVLYTAVMTDTLLEED